MSPKTKIVVLPAGDGDSLLIETEGARGRSRMLIDGGRKATARDFLAPLAQDGAFDLVVLTHFDADHIEGLLDWIDNDPPPQVSDVWFNGLRQLKEAKDGRRRPPPRGDGLKVLGPGQAAGFGEGIARRGYGWNAAFGGGAVAIAEEGELPRIEASSGARIVLLGPPRAKLIPLIDIWIKECGAFASEPTPVLGRVFNPPTPESVPKRATELNKSDQKPANGSSIAFVLEHAGRRFLFGADAHPDDLAAGLRRYEPGAGRVRFDAIKAPHHGAAGNCTSALIDLIESPIRLISTNGTRHNHPDPEAISRILLSTGEHKRLVFNYRSRCNEVWGDAKMQRLYNYEACFPAQEGTPTVVGF